MRSPLASPQRFTMPPGTICHLGGSFGGLAWKSAPGTTSEYFLLAACAQKRESREKIQKVLNNLHTLLAEQVSGTPQEVAVAYFINPSTALTELLRCVQGQIESTNNIIVTDSAYLSLERAGESVERLCQVQLLRPSATTTEIINAVNANTRIVLIEVFDSRRCTMLNLKKIAKAVRARAPKARLIVDISQTIGIFPIDFHDFDAAVATTYKGLGAASNGAALLLLNRARWSDEDIQPDYYGRHSTRRTDEGELQFESDIGDRFQPGGPALLNLFVLEDALQNMKGLNLGPQVIARHVRALVDRIVLALEKLAQENPQLRLDIIASEDPRRRGPHVSIRMVRDRAEEVYERLAERGVYLSYDDMGLRLGPRMHNGKKDVRRAIKAMGKVLLEMGYSPLDPTWVEPVK